MLRCGLLELVFPGAGHALSGSVPRAAAWLGVMVALFVATLVTPWAVWVVLLTRLASCAHAGWWARRARPARWAWKPALLVIAVSFGFTLAWRMEAAEAFKIPAASMVPTLQVGDLVMTDKLSLRWRPPARGEVVVFWNGDRPFVKRVIAIGGDRVKVERGVPVVNGTAAPRRSLGAYRYRDFEDEGGGSGTWTVRDGFRWQEEHGGHRYQVLSGDAEPTADHDYPTAGDGPPCGPLTQAPDGACMVPPGTLFLLGDNRDNSNDSRSFGAVPVDRVIGRVVGVWFSSQTYFDRIGRIE